MPAVKNVGEPCAGEPHARIDAAAGGNQASRLRRAAQAPLADPTKEGRHRPRNATSRAWQCLRSNGFSDRERDENRALAIA